MKGSFPGWLAPALGMWVLAGQTADRSASPSYGQEHIRALPHGFRLWDLLEKLTPAVAESPNLGGLGADRPPLLAFDAASWTQTPLPPKWA